MISKGNNSWAPHSIKESVVWKSGMTPEEYELELAYYYGCKMRKADYEPIWRQEANRKEVQIDDTWASPYLKGFDFYYSGMPLKDYREKYKEYFEKIRQQSPIN